jgi:hypothetical protein
MAAAKDSTVAMAVVLWLANTLDSSAKLSIGCVEGAGQPGRSGLAHALFVRDMGHSCVALALPDEKAVG